MSDYNNEFNGSESSSPKYGVHPTYSGAYHTDIAKPEEYYTNITILNDIIEAFNKFIYNHEEYAYLRTIDISNISVGDKISILDIDGEHEIISISEEHVEIDQNNMIVEVSIKNIRIVDDCLNKLKRADISFIYTEISKIILNDHYSCIEFFNIFSEYFKINEKTLYSALPRKYQLELMNSLQERLDINIIDPCTQLEKGKKIIVLRGEYPCAKDEDVIHTFNTEMYGEVMDIVNPNDRAKMRIKIRVEYERGDEDVIMDVLARVNKIKLMENNDIDLVW